MNPIPGQANVRILTLVDSDGAAVTDAGGVTAQYYLKATTGTNAGKWWKTADGTWSATEVSGGAMTHDVRGQWSASLAAGAWADQVEYKEYAVDSAGGAIVVARQIRGEYPGDKKRVLGTALTETTAGRLAAAEIKFGDVPTPAFTAASVNQTIDNPAPIAIAAGLLDYANGVESNMTPRQALRIMAAVLAGKVGGAGSGTETFKGLDGSTVRVTVTTDPAGNRTNVTYTPN